MSRRLAVDRGLWSRAWYGPRRLVERVRLPISSKKQENGLSSVSVSIVGGKFGLMEV